MPPSNVSVKTQPNLVYFIILYFEGILTEYVVI
nr:MAG TPA: hypothetical protein [Caudoviricetes sp.]